MSVVEHRDVYETPETRAETRVASSRIVVSPGQVIACVLGLVLAIVGAIAVARSGVDSSLNVPMVRAAGFNQSAMVGLGELVLGLLLILSALSYEGRGFIVAIGVIMVISGVVIGAAGPTILRDLGTVHGTGWALMVGGIIAIFAGSLGRIVKTRQTVTSI
jgi:hypothetical protein